MPLLHRHIPMSRVLDSVRWPVGESYPPSGVPMLSAEGGLLMSSTAERGVELLAMHDGANAIYTALPAALHVFHRAHFSPTSLRGFHSAMFRKRKPEADLADSERHRPFPAAQGQTTLSSQMGGISINTTSNLPEPRSALHSQNNIPDMHSEYLSEPAVSAHGAKHASWTGLTALRKALDEASGVLEPLKSAITGLSWCINAYEKEAEAHRDYERLKTTLDRLLQDLSIYVGDEMPPPMTPALVALTQGIKLEAERLSRKQTRKKILRYAVARNEVEEVVECYGRIQTLLERLKLNANLSMWKIVNEQAIDSRISRLPSSSSATYNSAESDALRRRACTEDTRVKVLQELQEWAEASAGKKLYWLNGMAGTGKTTIAYTLCKRLKSHGALAASFFCSRQRPECRKINRIIPSIAYQLALFSRPFRYALSNVLEKHPEAHNQTLPEQLDELVASPLRETKDTLPDGLVIVIDALDECENGDGIDRMLNALLVSVSDLPVKFFVASRPDTQILDRMRSEQGERVRRELRLHDLDKAVVYQDIKTYLSSELMHARLSSEDLDELVKRSDALFIFAATVVRYIGYSNFSRCSQRLKQVLGNSLSPEAGNYREIDRLYEIIMNAALEDEELDDAEREEILEVLFTIICAQEPLKPKTVAALLGTGDAGSVIVSLRPLSSVLQISEPNGQITMLHESFRDYIVDQRRSKRFYCDSRQRHRSLAFRCFDIIDAAPPFNICELPSSYLMDHEVPDIDQRVQSHISDELCYACKYWYAHIDAAELANGLTDRIFEFLSTRLLLWLEIVNLKRFILHGVSMLRKLQLWISRVQASSIFKRLAQDAWNFVTAFSTSPAVDSTPHIYISALFFWPNDRPTYLKYSHKFEHSVKISGLAMRQREETPLVSFRTDDTLGLNLIACSPDNLSVAYADLERDELVIWNIYTHQTARFSYTDFGFPTCITSIAYSPDGRYIISCVYGETNNIERNFLPSRESLYWARTGNNFGRGGIIIWNVSTGEQGVNVLGYQHPYRLAGAIYSPNGDYIAFSSSNGIIHVWDASRLQEIRTLDTCDSGKILWLACSPNNTHIACVREAGTYDYKIQIWDIHSGEIDHVHFPHNNQIQSSYGIDFRYITKSLAYAPNGRNIAVAVKSLFIYDVHGKDMVIFQAPGSNSLNSVAYSPSGDYMIAGLESGRGICIWDTRGKQMAARMVRMDSIGHFAYTPDGLRIVMTNRPTSIYPADMAIIKVWDTYAMQEKVPAEQTEVLGLKYITAMAFSSQGTYFATGSKDGIIRIWDTRTGQAISQMSAKGRLEVQSLAYSPDGTNIVSGHGTQLPTYPGATGSLAPVHIWDPFLVEPVGQPLYGQLDGVSMVSYTPNGEFIVSCSNYGQIVVWVAQNRQVIKRFTCSTVGYYGARSFVFHPETCQIAFIDTKMPFTPAGPLYLNVWGLKTGDLIRHLAPRGCWNNVWRLGFSSDGACVLAKCRVNREYLVWNLEEEQMQHETSLCDAGGRFFTYSPNGAYEISAFHETISVWSLQALQVVAELQGHPSNVRSLACSSNGAYLASGDETDTIRIWDISHLQRLMGSSLPGGIVDTQNKTQEGRVDVQNNPEICNNGDSAYHIPESGATARSNPSNWSIDQTGWIVDEGGRPMVWVPRDLHDRLVIPQNVAVLSTKGTLQLDFSEAKLGEQWAECFN
ncbi:Vegetative incompatibility protein HET-E-1 [Ceratobasidium sp. AG-Ba]|nr:Vegetative incompatibility protein HET-E-1 [Ceratobasidium sp. AG-Ba]